MNSQNDLLITSLQNPQVKNAVKLRQRSARDEQGLTIIEGYREIKRAIDNGRQPRQVFYCRELFQGSNEDKLIEAARKAGSEIYGCKINVFEKMSYRDRPDGLIILAAQVRISIKDIKLPKNPLLVIAESIEKPGNLGTIIRTSDGAGAHAVIVCDKCTDIDNPNVIRSSIGTLYSLPVAEATTEETLSWLKEKNIQILSATPHTDRLYTDIDYTKGTAIVLGTEQYGLSKKWMDANCVKIKIPMLGQADSLNVSAAATILLYEAARQRKFRK